MRLFASSPLCRPGAEADEFAKVTGRGLNHQFNVFAAGTSCCLSPSRAIARAPTSPSAPNQTSTKCWPRRPHQTASAAPRCLAHQPSLRRALPRPPRTGPAKKLESAISTPTRATSRRCRILPTPRPSRRLSWWPSQNRRTASARTTPCATGRHTFTTGRTYSWCPWRCPCSTSARRCNASCRAGLPHGGT